MILALDVGITTGAALAEDDGFIMDTWVIDAAALSDNDIRFFRDNPVVKVCMELPAPSLASSTATLRDVVEQMRQWFPDAHIVRPGVWKQSAVALQPLPDEVQHLKLSAHEKDAIGIARWYREYLRTH